MRNIFKNIGTSNQELSPYIKWLCFRVLTFPELIYELLRSDNADKFFQLMNLGSPKKQATKFLIKKHKNSCENLDYAIAVMSDDIKEAKPFIKKVILPKLEEKIELYFEETKTQPFDDSNIGYNIDLLSSTLKLSTCETNLLRFYAHIENNNILNELIEELPRTSSIIEQITILSGIINEKEYETSKALNNQAKLFSTGLINKQNYIRGINSSLRIPEIELDSNLKVNINLPDTSVMQLISHAFADSEPSKLAMNDFKYIENINELKTIIKHAANLNEKGINILVYGDPGTGKTELAKTLIHSANLDLKTVSFKDEDDNTLSANNRLKCFNLIQSAHHAFNQSAVIFDEATDLFQNKETSFFSIKEAVSKKHINSTLENNHLISFYLCNSIEGIDPAYLSRFSYILHMPSLSTKQRKKILTNAISAEHKQYLKATWLNQMASNSRVTARHIENATRIVRMAKTPADKVQSKIESVLTMYLKHTDDKETVKQPLPDFYHSGFINTSVSLGTLLKNLKGDSTAKLLFFGLPGTGKTQFAYYLLDKIKTEYMTIRSSDILDCYVGNTEKNIAATFSKARQEKKAIIIDEIDSLISAREGMQSQWQRTAVNEFLTQLDDFDGIVVCTTNHLKTLDSAAFRRFHSKIEFNPLANNQKLALLKRIVKAFGLTKDLTWLATADKLNKFGLLTPGDFNAVNGRLKWQGITSLTTYITELKKEHSIKQPSNRIGF
ncbi:MAG: AAA family ATPase [Colwellia sp.]